jgi:hypothetical protein
LGYVTATFKSDNMSNPGEQKPHVRLFRTNQATVHSVRLSSAYDGGMTAWADALD